MELNMAPSKLMRDATFVTGLVDALNLHNLREIRISRGKQSEQADNSVAEAEEPRRQVWVASMAMPNGTNTCVQFWKLPCKTEYTCGLAGKSKVDCCSLLSQMPLRPSQMHMSHGPICLCCFAGCGHTEKIEFHVVIPGPYDQYKYKNHVVHKVCRPPPMHAW